MELENIFTHAVVGRSRYFDMNAGEDADFVINCHIEVFCIPNDADEDEEDAAYENPELAEKIGTIEGQLVLGTEMMKFGENVYNQCDDAGANTEFIYSALMENGGPLSEDQYFDLFIIDNIDVPEEMFNDIIYKLPEILLTHYHTSPEMLIVYPAPLPYDDMLDEIERNLAYEIHSEVKKQILLLIRLPSCNTSKVFLFSRTGHLSRPPLHKSFCYQTALNSQTALRNSHEACLNI